MIKVCISPDDALIVQIIYIGILLLFILWKATKYPCCVITNKTGFKPVNLMSC